MATLSDSNILRKLTLSAYHAELLQAVIKQLKKDDNKLMSFWHISGTHTPT